MFKPRLLAHGRLLELDLLRVPGWVPPPIWSVRQEVQ